MFHCSKPNWHLELSRNLRHRKAAISTSIVYGNGLKRRGRWLTWKLTTAADPLFILQWNQITSVENWCQRRIYPIVLNSFFHSCVPCCDKRCEVTLPDSFLAIRPYDVSRVDVEPVIIVIPSPSSSTTPQQPPANGQHLTVAQHHLVRPNKRRDTRRPRLLPRQGDLFDIVCWKR